MTIIKIINGTYGHRPEGSNYVIPVAAGDPPISVDDIEAERLVKLGVAVIPLPDAPLPEGGKVGESVPAEIAGHLDPEQFKAYTVAELKKLAADMEIDVTGKKKDEIIAAICAVEVTAPAEDDAPAPDVEDVIE